MKTPLVFGFSVESLFKDPNSLTQHVLMLPWLRIYLQEPILFHMEEEEVDSHDPHDDLEVFKTSCDIMRASVSDINKLKQNKEAVS